MSSRFTYVKIFLLSLTLEHSQLTDITLTNTYSALQFHRIDISLQLVLALLDLARFHETLLNLELLLRSEQQKS